MSSDSSVHAFVEEHRRLLDLELKSEEEEERAIASSSASKGRDNKNDGGDESPSHVLRSLDASEVSVGLYGRTVVTLTSLSGDSSKPETLLLRAHRFIVGDEVEIYSKQSPDKRNKGGVISAVTDTSISVALFDKRGAQSNRSKAGDDEGSEDAFGAPPLSLLPKSSVEVHRKLIKALDDLKDDSGNHSIAGNIIQSLFGGPQHFMASAATLKVEPVNPNLDESQLEAISFALDSARPIALIHGPPGTGKTTTLAELIHQAVHVRKMKVLVTAPSNVAVDNVLERLVQSNPTSSSSRRGGKRSGQRLRTVRLGHPARIKDSILPYSLESLVQNAEGTEIVADVRTELAGFLRVLTNPRSRGADKRVAYREVKVLRKEVRRREEKIVQELISQAQVVLATNVGAANRILDRVEDGFDLVVIDEAAQALEASCWIPILRGRRVVLAGDHCQLPPTIKNKASEVQRGLSKTLFERIMQMYGDTDGTTHGNVSRMLRVQYRMHEDIANWASAAMYHGKLETFAGVKNHKLSDLTNRQESSGEIVDTKDATLLLVDTTGCAMHESLNSAGSRYNEGEAEIVARHVRSLLELGLKPHEIAVISPYNGQVELLRNLLLPDTPSLEIKSVDGFQGGEREAVILSLVRSSDRGGAAGIGFLKDNRRLNVAVTRARRQLTLVCDCETVSQSGFIQGLITWMEEHGEYRSAAEHTASSDFFESEILAAEAELAKLMESAAIREYKTNKGSNLRPTRDPEVMSSSLSPTIPPSVDKGVETDKREELLDKVSDFASTGKRGDEMRLNSNLSRFDRRVVHEFATQLGLGHHSEGVDGLNRCMILTIDWEGKAPFDSAATSLSPVDRTMVTDSQDIIPNQSLFAALNESSDESGTDGEVPDLEDQSGPNQLLSRLADERRLRHEEAKPAPIRTPTKTKKAKGQKLGGQKTASAPVPSDKSVDDLDDMAFLDTQIEEVQNSHGRRVEGRGAYRSIVNGILIGKPPPRTEQANTISTSALSAKLKKAKDGRKKKAKKKK